MCTTSADCSGYNGDCDTSTGQCACHLGWSGTTCATVAFSAGARRAFNSSLWTWGGSMARDDDGLIHMFASELTNDCGILHYCSNSRVIHLTADDPLGPYKRQGVALDPRPPPAWDSGAVHGPTIHRVSGGRWALFYMGTNNSWDPKDGKHPNCTVKIDPNQGDRSSRRLGLALAPSPWGPWVRYPAPIFGPGHRSKGEWDFEDVSNATPILLQNGTTILLYKGRGGSLQAMGAARSDAFDGPFVRTSPKSPVLSRHVEDTWGWVQPLEGGMEVLHVLSHVGNGNRAAGGHAWSVDGVKWHDTTAAAPAYTGRVKWADGSSTTLARRERPQGLLRRVAKNATGSVGVPEYLSTSAQTEGYHAGCPDGGKGLREACRSFTMVERVAL